MENFEKMKIDDKPLTEQEKFVLEMAEQGEIADLKKQFGDNEAGRRLRAKFLEALLTDDITDGPEKFKPHRRGIRISHAVIAEPLDLENAKVSHIVVFDSFIFEEKATFQDARFARHLFLNHCEFRQEADFHRVKVDLSLFCRNATFKGSVNFGSADIGEQFSATEAKFLHEQGMADFNGMKVGQSAFLKKAIFKGPMDFRTADIGGQFNANEAQFLNEKKTANFNGMKVGQAAFFNKATFKGPVDFIGADIGKQFNAEEAQFLHDKEMANFDSMKVGQHAFLKKAIFKGPVDFGRADIVSQFNASEAQFLHEQGKANFNGMKVGQAAFFKKAIFKGPVDFLNADIRGQFNARQAQLQSQSDFEGMKVGLSAFFEGAEFGGPVDLSDAHLLDLQMGYKPIPKLNLERTRIHRKLIITATEINIFTARHLTVQGPTELKKVTIREEADLRDANFQQVNFVNVAWPERREGKARVWLDGISFQALSTRKEPGQEEDWGRILDWLSLSRFNTQVYQLLDEYFQRCGLKDWAYKFFVAEKRREWSRWRQRRWWRKWWAPALWVNKIFWDWLAGHGRKPARTLWISLVLIMLGAFFLNPSEVLSPEVLRNFTGFQESPLHDVILRLIVSLYGFVSAIPGWGSNLCLTDLKFHTFVYLWIHRICGWILIPIGLAAVYTRLK